MHNLPGKEIGQTFMTTSVKLKLAIGAFIHKGQDLVIFSGIEMIIDTEESQEIFVSHGSPCLGPYHGPAVKNNKLAPFYQLFTSYAIHVVLCPL